MQKAEKKCEDVIKIFFGPAKLKFSYKRPIKKIHLKLRLHKD